MRSFSAMILAVSATVSAIGSRSAANRLARRYHAAAELNREVHRLVRSSPAALADFRFAVSSGMRPTMSSPTSQRDSVDGIHPNSRTFFGTTVLLGRGDRPIAQGNFARVFSDPGLRAGLEVVGAVQSGDGRASDEPGPRGGATPEDAKEAPLNHGFVHSP